MAGTAPWPSGASCVVAAMVGAAYAAVPLYRLFCEATGFDGTPRIATKPSDTVLDETVTIRFDANVAPGPALALRAGAEHRARSRSARTRWPSTAPPTRPTGPSGAWRPSTCFPSRSPPSSTSCSASASPSSCCSRARALRCRSASSSIRRSTADKDAFWVRAHHAVLHVLSRDGAEAGGGQGRRSCDTGGGATQAGKPGRFGFGQVSRPYGASSAAGLRQGDQGAGRWPTRTPSITTTTW